MPPPNLDFIKSIQTRTIGESFQVENNLIVTYSISGSFALVELQISEDDSTWITIDQIYAPGSLHGCIPIGYYVQIISNTSTSVYNYGIENAILVS
jgi:hypothetical protein